MRIKRYHVISAADAGTLQSEVNKLLPEGWQPFGQIVISEPAHGSNERFFFQVVVQYEGEIRS